jgi:large subunit ribosomal protein L10
MPNLVNTMMVRELREDFADADGMILVSLNGLTVAESQALRTALADHGVPLKMVRNRLARIALGERGIEAPPGMLNGNVAVAWGGIEETILAAKAISKSEVKKSGKLAFRGAVLDGRMLGDADASALADLPGPNEMRAILLGTLLAPARSIATLIQAPGASLARVVQAHVDAQGGGGEAASAD